MGEQDSLTLESEAVTFVEIIAVKNTVKYLSSVTPACRVGELFLANSFL